MKNKLYYKNPYMTTFLTKLADQHQDESGNWYVVLEETAFYPTGGGQPFDTGTLNDSQVINVEEIDGEIRHYVDKPLSMGEVKGLIDWDRRFDHMQQHAGQHILSAAFADVTDYETVSFHLGKEILTIDLETEELSEQDVAKVEELANQIVMENRRIEVNWITKEELSQYQLRKQPIVIENIRLVIIPNFDYNGCGGTHPSTTGQVGSIKIMSWERQRKRIRVQFICGNRVRTQLHQKTKVMSELSQLVSASEQQMVETVKRVVNRNVELEKSLEELSDKLLQYEARDLLNLQRENNVVGQVFEGRSIQELQKIARFIVTETEEIIVLLVTENDNRLQMVFACGNETNASMKEIMKDALLLINGKGGGNKSLAQGGGERLMSGVEMIEYVIVSLQG
jgi:alanyl-tRNA synthetase